MYNYDKALAQEKSIYRQFGEVAWNLTKAAVCVGILCAGVYFAVEPHQGLLTTWSNPTTQSATILLSKDVNSGWEFGTGLAVVSGAAYFGFVGALKYGGEALDGIREIRRTLPYKLHTFLNPA